MSFFGMKSVSSSRNGGDDDGDDDSAYDHEEKREDLGRGGSGSRFGESAPPADSPSVGSSSFFVGLRSYYYPEQSNIKETANQVQTPKPNCCRRLMTELNPCQPWFAVQDRATERKFDIPESFSPATCLAFVWKVAATGLTIGTLVYNIVVNANPEFYFAYMTNWALLVSVLYLSISLWNTVAASRTSQPPDRAGCRIRTTWVLYELSMHLQLVVTIVFWALIYEPGVTALNFVSIVPHGVIAFVVLVDGNFVNRIPVRWTHWYGFVMPVEVLYVVWTVIHALATDIGNPNRSDNDPDTNDDSIYKPLSWNDNWQRSLILSVIVVFGVGPVLYYAMWLVSLYHVPCACWKDRRRYVDSYRDEDEAAAAAGAGQNRATVNDIEEGSIFGRWR